MAGKGPLIFKTQDPKYDINVIVNTDGNITDAYLINATTGMGIPFDEPVFMLRAKDKHAIPTIQYYMDRVTIVGHIKAVGVRLAEFIGFSESKPTHMKEPDTKVEG